MRYREEGQTKTKAAFLQFWRPIAFIYAKAIAVMKADFLWPGLALLLVNGVPNIIALILRFAGNRSASYTWGVIAGVLLIAWTVFELVFIPNSLSVFYLVLGVLQLLASIRAKKTV